MWQRLVLLMLAVIVPATLWAAPADIPQTGQTTSYAPGDDGDLQKGVDWPTPRFALKADGTVGDRLTGLIWARGPSATVGGCAGEPKTWSEALDYVACLNNVHYLGYNDWLLPNVNEMASLLNYEKSDGSAWLRSVGFYPSGNWYWTSSSVASVPNDAAWSVCLDDGNVTTGSKTFRYLVWPVRNARLTASRIALPQTGQTASYTAQDDGDLRRGIAWPSPRFDKSAAGMIGDRLTGLVWARNAGAPNTAGCAGGKKNWQDALIYVDCLNSTNYLGFSDWRLPNINELQSLLHKGVVSNDAWLMEKGFTNFQSSYYWTSNSYAADPVHYAWVFHWDTAYIGKDESAAVWPVRGGAQGAPNTRTLQVTKSGTGSGIVESTPDGISCGPTCMTDYAVGTLVTVTASPLSGSTFNGWSGACSGTGTCTVAMNSAANVTATFRLIASPPESITVPASDTDGIYSVTWSASTTAGVTYTLQEATNVSFAAGVRTVYSGTALKTSITGRTKGVKYYYRIKASKTGYSNSPWKTAANGCGIACAVPGALTIPAGDADGSYLVTWGASQTPDVTYILQEATDSDFSANLRNAYAGTAAQTNIGGRANGTTYYYRVKASKSGVPVSAWRIGNAGCAVPGSSAVAVPTTITVPTSDADGAYSVTWSASTTAGVTYTLQEATNATFTANLRNAYFGSGRTVDIAGRTAGQTYYYRVRAIKPGLKDSAWKAATTECAVGG